MNKKEKEKIEKDELKTIPEIYKYSIVREEKITELEDALNKVFKAFMIIRRVPNEFKKQSPTLYVSILNEITKITNDLMEFVNLIPERRKEV